MIQKLIIYSFLMLGLGACNNVTNECPAVSQWWYHAYPDTAQNQPKKNLGVMHNPSTIDTMGGHRGTK